PRRADPGVSHPDEAVRLERPELLERDAARRLVRRHDHLADDRNPIGREEHVLGADEADAFGAELASALGVEGRISVGPHAEPFLAIAVCPGQELGDLVAELALDGLDAVEQDLAGSAIDGDPVTFSDDATTDFADA